jgi:hypothetical protein
VLEELNRSQKSWTYHEVTFHKFQLVCKAFLLGISGSTLNLVVIVVQTGDVCTSELCDFSRWPTNTTANIEDFVSVLDTNLRGEVVFVTGNGLVERFPVCETAEVEGLAPTVLVEICSEVVIARNFSRAASCNGGTNVTYCLVRVAYSALRAWGKEAN